MTASGAVTVISTGLFSDGDVGEVVPWSLGWWSRCVGIALVCWTWVSLVDRKPLRSSFKCPLLVAICFGKCFLTSDEVRPGQVAK